jgi:hypothetical protein
MVLTHTFALGWQYTCHFGGAITPLKTTTYSKVLIDTFVQ